MRKLSILGALVVLMVAASLTVAASPSPSSSPAPTPAPSPSPTSGSGATTAPSTTSTAPSTTAPKWSADIHPIHKVWGVADVDQFTDGRGDLHLHLRGLDEKDQWTVSLQGGTIENPNADEQIAFLSGADVVRNGSDLLTVKLDPAQMDAFRKDRASDGVVVFVSDGTRQSAAEFPVG